MAPSHLFVAQKSGRAGLHTTFDIWHCLGPFPCALVGTFPTKRSEACSERSDEVRGCKLHITQSKDCT